MSVAVPKSLPLLTQQVHEHEHEGPGAAPRSAVPFDTSVGHIVSVLPMKPGVHPQPVFGIVGYCLKDRHKKAGVDKFMCAGKGFSERYLFIAGRQRALKALNYLQGREVLAPEKFYRLKPLPQGETNS
jgi:hypothetical protein